MHTSIVGKRVATIGGGSGGFIVNRGLHAYPVLPTAICTVFDSGGSSGILRDEFGALPQGDLRRCLVALAGGEDDTLRELFQYRFTNGHKPSALADHSLGNLLLLAAEKIWGPVEGVRRVGRVLGLSGEVLPVSIDDATLCAELDDGSTVRGETALDLRPLTDKRSIARVWLAPDALICREAAEAIMRADVIVLGPGDLYTSIIPNLLVRGVADAIAASAAKVVYVSNLMTKYAETRDYTLAHFLTTLLSYGIGREKFDAVLINTANIPRALVTRYAREEKSAPVHFASKDAKKLSVFTRKIITGDFLSSVGLAQGLIRHDSAKLARKLVEI